MKITIINTLYTPYKIGGAEVSVQILAESLAEKGHQVQVICLTEKKEAWFDNVNNVDVCYIPLVNMYWPYGKKRKPIWKRLLWHLVDQYNPIMAKTVEKQIKLFKPDVVHTNNLAGFSVSVWDVVKKLNIKLVHTSRDYYLFHPNCTLFSKGVNVDPESLSVRLWSWFKKIKSSKVDHFVGISEFVTDLHKSKGFCKMAEFDTIYNPVPIPKVDKIPRVGKTIRVGFIGRLSVEKGFDEFCNIASKLRSDVQNIQFIAAGRFEESPQGKLLEQLAHDNEVKLLGFTSLELFLSQVDAVVLPIKWREPFGRTVVECAYHVPVFVTPFGGVKELMEVLPNVYNINEAMLLPNINKNKKNGDVSNFSNHHCYTKYLDKYLS